jgi:hypothetical protein
VATISAAIFGRGICDRFHRQGTRTLSVHKLNSVIKTNETKHKGNLPGARTFVGPAGGGQFARRANALGYLKSTDNGSALKSTTALFKLARAELHPGSAESAIRLLVSRCSTASQPHAECPYGPSRRNRRCSQDLQSACQANSAKRTTGEARPRNHQVCTQRLN